MANAIDILTIILPVFAALFLGMLCRAKTILTTDGVSALKKTAINITLPAVSLRTFARADYSAGRMLVPVWIFASCCIALMMGFAARKLLRMKHRLSPYLCTSFESGMLGFSLYPLIYGDLSPFAIVVMGQTFFIFTLYKLLLAGARSTRALFREAVSSPSLWALLIGVLLGATGAYQSLDNIGVQELFDSLLSFVAAPTSFLILLTIGYDLKPVDIQWFESLKAVAARAVIMATLLAATLLINKYLLNGVIEPSAAIMLFILPPPFVLPAFSHDESEAGFLSSTLSFMTLLTILGFVIMAVLS